MFNTKTDLFHFCFTLNLLAIALVYNNEGGSEFRKGEYINAIDYYTEGIKVNCTDPKLRAILFTNRATVQFHLGENSIKSIAFIVFFFSFKSRVLTDLSQTDSVLDQTGPYLFSTGRSFYERLLIPDRFGTSQLPDHMGKLAVGFQLIMRSIRECRLHQFHLAVVLNLDKIAWPVPKRTGQVFQFGTGTVSKLDLLFCRSENQYGQHAL